MFPQLRIVNEIPKNLSEKTIEKAVQSFVDDSECKEDKIGFYNQTLEGIVNATYFRIPGRFFWLLEHENECVGFVLTHVSKDVDNTLCYHMTHAWLDKKFRHTSVARTSVNQLTKHAKESLCKHILIPSSRGSRGYCRFLGIGWKPYLTILKQDI